MDEKHCTAIIHPSLALAGWPGLPGLWNIVYNNPNPKSKDGIDDRVVRNRGLNVKRYFVTDFCKRLQMVRHHDSDRVLRHGKV